jgi:hypothetical protein
MFWSAPHALDSDFTPEDPLALDYLGQQVGLWLFKGFTTRTSRAQNYAVVLYGLDLADKAVSKYEYPSRRARRCGRYGRILADGYPLCVAECGKFGMAACLWIALVPGRMQQSWIYRRVHLGRGRPLPVLDRIRSAIGGNCWIGYPPHKTALTCRRSARCTEYPAIYLVLVVDMRVAIRPRRGVFCHQVLLRSFETSE